MAETVLAKMAVEIAANTAGFNRSLQATDNKLNSFAASASRSAKGIAGALAGALAGISLTAFLKQVIDVSSQFQKFEAVLTNTLGSQSAAQIALRDIEKFASQTPFAVDELTSSFVKLANQGFQPTTDELRKLGDLASSTGKGFDQLTEAIIDAQTGEFERLKEFGIRASKQGDQVKFTFKGVETQTKFTATAIRDYVLSLGEAEGVSGAMAAISGTLGGQISNLGDSWNTFLKIIGDGNKGALAGVTKLLSTILTTATKFLTTHQQIQEQIQVDAQSEAVKQVQELEKATGDLAASAFKVIDGLNLQKEALVDLSRQYSVNDEDGLKQIEALNRQALVIDAQILAINDYTKAQEAQHLASEASTKKHNDEAAALTKLREAREKSFVPDSIAAYNNSISLLSKELENVNVKDTSRIRILSAQIAGYQAVIDRIERLKSSFKDFDFIVKPPDLTPLAVNMEEVEKRISQSLTNIKNTAKEKIKEVEITILDFGGVVSSAASGIGQALGNAIAGGANFGKALLGVLGGVLVQLGEMLITAGVGIIGFKLALKSLNGYVAIAAGIALVALGTAVGASIKNLGSSSSGGTGGSTGGASPVSNGRTVSATEAQDVKVAGEVVIKGQDLFVIFSNYNNSNKFLKAGG